MTCIAVGLVVSVPTTHGAEGAAGDSGKEVAATPVDVSALAQEIDQLVANELQQLGQAPRPEIDAYTFRVWQDECARQSIYFLDVRSEQDFNSGHMAGSVHAHGGQLIECPEDWIGSRNSRILLLDDDGARARIVGSWLRRLGYPRVHVLAEGVDPNFARAIEVADRQSLPAIRNEDCYYSRPGSLEEKMQMKLEYMEWQSGLDHRLQKEGLLASGPFADLGNR